jgi:hypothetical protein
VDTYGCGADMTMSLSAFQVNIQAALRTPSIATPALAPRTWPEPIGRFVIRSELGQRCPRDDRDAITVAAMYVQHHSASASLFQSRMVAIEECA